MVPLPPEGEGGLPAPGEPPEWADERRRGRRDMLTAWAQNFLDWL